MRTPEDIYDDIYEHIKGSELDAETTGEVTDKREKESTKEDVTIVVYTANGVQLQYASVNVNVYVHDIQVNGQWRKDRTRCRQLARIAAEVLKKQGNNKDYRFTIDSQAVKQSPEGKNEHIINTRLDYRSVQK